MTYLYDTTPHKQSVDSCVLKQIVFDIKGFLQVPPQKVIELVPPDRKKAKSTGLAQGRRYHNVFDRNFYSFIPIE